MSSRGLEKLIEWEGFKTEVYKDSAGLPTIGVGHLLTKDELRSGKISIGGKDVKYADGLTENQVTALLQQDIVSRETAVRNLVRVPLSQNQFDALVSFVFNIGRQAFQNSTLLRVLNDGRYQEVPDQLDRWVYSGGKKVDGLINRRRNEIALWNSKTHIVDGGVFDSTIEWLLKRKGIKLIAQHNGEPVIVEYNDKLQQFTVEKQ